MPHNENPTPKKGRASRVSFGDWTHTDLSLEQLQEQHLMRAYGLGPEAARVLCDAIYGGAAHG